MDEPVDLSSLDPDTDMERTERVTRAAMRRVRESSPATRAQGEMPGGLTNGSRWARPASLTAVLVLGVAAGWLARGSLDPTQSLPTLTRADADSIASPVSLAGVFDDIGLSDDQRATINTVIEVRDPASDRLFVAVAEELHRLLEARNERIRDVLLPDQRSEYDRRLAEESVVGFRREYLMGNARVRLEAMLDPRR